MKMKPHEKHQILLNLERMWAYFNGVETETPCSVCIWHRQGACKRWNETIPKETLPVGCPDWEFEKDSMPL